MLGIVRLRRYRPLLLFAVIAVIVFFHVNSFGETTSSFSVEKLKEYTATVPKPNTQDVQQPVPDVSNEAPIPPPAIPPIEKPSPRPSEPQKKLPPAEDKESSPKPADTGDKSPKPEPADTVNTSPKPTDVSKIEEALIEEPTTLLDGPVQEHWVKSPEHYPLPLESIIPLPKEYKALPQIQASFAKEGETKRKVRLERQKAVKDAMKHSWKGYKEHAWGHDELSPVTKYYRDPFGGWGATLVDALDTLWIVGLEEEFLEAVEAVGKIDFTVTPIQVIPVFETVIRYLGGLVGAYDVSGGKHQILLNKAIELADMLYGVFDTPNRMPILHWGWRPRQTAKQTRAEARSVSAELGSLTVEFTRLAQITGNNSYFDAVQRITDALEEYQPKTALPGMWPLMMDATGCQVIKVPIPERKTTPSQVPQPPNGIFAEDTNTVVSSPAHMPEKRQEPQVQNPDWLGELQGGKVISESEKDQKDKVEADARGLPPGLSIEAQSGKIFREEGRSDAIGAQLVIPVTSTAVAQARTSPSCLPQGLTKSGPAREERFTLGGMADSLYEYLIKEYVLLGGASDQYKKMYEQSIDLAKKHLFYRPLAAEDPDVLLSGNVYVNNGGEITFDTDSGHLSCFTGGMLALGARALNREADLEIGAKLTDGCVWAYASFESGIMPESFRTAYCQDADNCKFNETHYYEQLVPKYRLPKTDSPAKTDTEPSPVEEQLGISSASAPKEYPITLAEIAKEMIEEEALPTGFTRVMDRRYILRPEAIESVFIMYRVTADTTWQDKGWKMWQSLEKATRTDFAFSAINDVTRDPSDPKFAQLDEMESFFLAETIKYYYLLFSEPDLVSLDDYVLNTEAHPLRRPRPPS